jgi:hypothetical protein
MLSASYRDLVVYDGSRRIHRRRSFRGPIAAVLTIAAVLASGAVLNRLDAASTHAATAAHQPQPFDYFPR